MSLEKDLGIEKSIIVEGKNFEFVKTRMYTPFSIYRNEDMFLRIGPKDIVENELNFHKNLLNLKFPVAEIVSEGQIGERSYYIETSLGEKHLGELFWEDYKTIGRVSERNFDLLLSISESLAKAQLKTARDEKNYESFYYGVHVDYILEELPRLREEILEAFDKIKDRTFLLPTVITHGDFNPHNICEKGVIDFGNSFEGVAGYDLVSNIYSTYCFPKTAEYEVSRRYELTEEQMGKYIDSVDTIYEKDGLPKLSNFLSEFILVRYIWSAVRMQKLPKIQKWRYDNLKIILMEYLSDNDISKIVVGF